MGDNIYTDVVLNNKITINYNNVNNNLHNFLENIIKKKEGTCINEGFIKPDSVKLLTFSNGELFGNFIVFNVMYQCKIANSSEGMTILCKVKSITKVGIRAEIDDEISPFIIFVSRDYHYDNEYFTNISEEDTITVKVIGQRYELNDSYISIIAELEKPIDKISIKSIKKLNK